ncbi:triacylglycerol lipase [Variovorax sp. dw_308]|uniref:esterase/lipase family protein n=1 Tax=Variovorax sp. dw_308 TaxID=2721546 RepID=UPI001C45A51D|nr:alpha/beta hydrolase [Variovorax sp. dw_308]
MISFRLKVHRTAFGLGLAALAMLASSGQAGASDVVDIDADARFESSVANAGMTHPLDFKYGGIYMASEPDSSKEVVLFVHGANGSPRDLSEVAENLDPATQQAWFAYYASGNSVAQSGTELADGVLALLQRYRVSHISVFAHSMGGLVAWRAVAEMEKRIIVSRLVSVNTPWDGSSAARLGIWFSRSPLPIWTDLAPGSEALMAIWRQDIATPFTLVYTIEHDDPRCIGDGTISRRSQTSAEMQRRAAFVVKEIGTHTSVLHSAAALRMGLLLR